MVVEEDQGRDLIKERRLLQNLSMRVRHTSTHVCHRVEHEIGRPGL